jgi:hypothetical protein
VIADLFYDNFFLGVVSTYSRWGGKTFFSSLFVFVWDWSFDCCYHGSGGKGQSPFPTFSCKGMALSRGAFLVLFCSCPEMSMSMWKMALSCWSLESWDSNFGIATAEKRRWVGNDYHYYCILCLGMTV